MALTESKMIDLGTQAPDFNLIDTVSNLYKSFNDVRGINGTVVIFSCNHCPYVIHINDLLVSIANEYIPSGVGFVAISSNDVVKYTEDSPDKMAIVAKVLKYPFPYLYDETQEVARAYNAACTPDIYVFDRNNMLVYRGRIDDSRPNSGKPLTGKDLRLALELMLRSEHPIAKQYPSAGCNIKWKP
jgi:peroxiredoxin